MTPPTRLAHVLLLSPLLFLGGQLRAEEEYFPKPWPQAGPSANLYLAPPAPADAPLRAIHARVVDFGHDFGTWVAGPHFRGSPQDPKASKEVPSAEFEFDGNPRTRDTVQHLPFSLTRPFSTWDVTYDDEHVGATFYGGAAFFFANRAGGGITERFINADHCATGHFPRDNWALHMFTFNKQSPWVASALWLWLKPDFSNGGDQHRVSIDANSVIHMREARYWNGYDGVRMVLRDGEQFYLSEKTFSGCDLYILKPADTRWAPFNPKPPFDIRFDAASAKFAKQDFKDVTAAGFHLFKDSLTPDVGAFKFYAFELDATVHRPERPSETLAMESVADFCISRTEIPYAFWKKIYKWANNNNYAQFDRPGFLFEENGDIGSMEFDGESHSPDEPVTGITLHDAAAWCNALSEYEAKTPCYYTDAACTKVFRWVRQSSLWKEPENFPPLHVKWSADGYRLPTPAEWLAASDPAETAEVSTGSRPVGLGKANSKGLYDMSGNVRELAWDEEALDPASKKSICLMGGSFLPGDPMKSSASPWGDAIRLQCGFFDGGFRVLRKEEGGAKPTFNASIPDGLAWKAPVGETRGGDVAARVPKGVVDMVEIPAGQFRAGDVDVTITHFQMGKTEVSYRQWLAVRQWAEAHGYEFNHDGDIGNMEWKSNPAERYPDEPVANISHRDAMAWCNALSEIEKVTPVYYEDKELSRPYRKANRYKPLMFDEWLESDKHKGKFADGGKFIGGAYIKWDADGYRLPTVAEQSYALGAGSDATDASAWTYGNSAGKTQPVAKKTPNAFGLHDSVGNVMEWAGSFPPVYTPFTFVNPVSHAQPCLDSGGTGGMPVRGGSVHQRHPSYFEWLPGGKGMVNADLAYPDLGLRVARHPQSLELDVDGKRYRLVGARPEEVLLLSGKRAVVDGEIQGDTIKVKSIKEAQ